MELGHAKQLEYILGHVPVGVAILDSTTLDIIYANSYLTSQLNTSWNHLDVIGQPVATILPEAMREAALPLLRQVAATGQRLQYEEVPYEGFLETRGRTYWRVVVERSPVAAGKTTRTRKQNQQAPLLITIEDVTNSVRSRLHLNAIQHISSAIAGASALPLVLDRILQALQEMVGSKRCAILLIEQSISDSEARISGYDERQRSAIDAPASVVVTAQKGIHLCAHDWHPLLNERILLGRVVRERRTLVITDTSTIPDIELPSLDNHGEPCRPGSVLCVPIFDSYPPYLSQESASMGEHIRPVLGTIEVYHRRTRGFPPEEVELLNRFAQQAGLAIQNARLFRSIDRWARVASRNAHQKENVMQAIPDGVMIFDPRWRIADANHTARKLFGWSDNVIGLPITQALTLSQQKMLDKDLACLDEAQLIQELERRALQGQIDEYKIIGGDGQHYTLRCSYTPIRDDLGDIFAFIIIYHDVTEEVAARERIEAEVVARTAELAQRNEALQLARIAQELASARMEVLLESLPSGVLHVSNDYTITLINRHAVELLQRIGVVLEPLNDLATACKKAIGLNCADVFRAIPMYSSAGSMVTFEEQPLSRALLQGTANEAELHITKKDGQTIHLLVNAAPLRAPDGTITSAILVIQEITRIKLLERAREDFFTTMAHELKTPLANIRAHLSALLARDLQWSSEEQHDFLHTADEQVERLVGMVNHFLDASRVEAGALRMQMEAILLPEMIEDLQDRLEALITSSQRSLKVVLPPQLPAVQGDYELIMSVLINLLSNAFRYAPEGDIVLLEAELVNDPQTQQPTGVTLRVTDRGIGMTSEQQTAIFTRFSTFAAAHRPNADRPGQPTLERRRGTARWSPATGLGLYISRGIIEAHHSTLEVKSGPGLGAVFAFTLPTFTGKRELEPTETIL
ncbi:MAG TPA: PAS domain-containing protein [Ktedonobacteraceae bacterium]|nr:PAS domain-containing protein [Ktedonobacteraceae bacterium]